jgi:hypothetical protein
MINVVRKLAQLVVVISLETCHFPRIVVLRRRIGYGVVVLIEMALGLSEKRKSRNSCEK